MSGSAVTAETLAAPPDPPGSLTNPPGPASLRRYVDELARWRDDLMVALRELDARSAVASDPASFTAELTVAMTLAESIDRRTDEVRGARGDPDSAAPLIWGRLPDPFGRPSAFSLVEASTLVIAVHDRLHARLASDPVAGSGAAPHVDPVRAAIERCQAMSVGLTQSEHPADALAEQLTAALAGSDPRHVAAEITWVAATVELLERDLIKAAGARSAVTARAGRLAARRTELAAREADAQRTATACRDKIAAPPRLAIPSVIALEAPPTLPEPGAPVTSWLAARDAQRAYESRLEQLGAGLEEADRRYRAPLATRDELRGIATAYRAKARAAGLVSPALEGRYDEVRTALWTAPCDLAAAQELVRAYERSVQVAARRVDERPR